MFSSFISSFFAARALVFGFYYSVFSFKIPVILLADWKTVLSVLFLDEMLERWEFVTFIILQILSVILLELPGLLFFSTYTLLVLFWAEIYYQV